MSTGRYAENTDVSSERSRMEIERTLSRYGASSFMYATKQDMAVVGFHMRDRQIRFTLPLPDRSAAEFTQTPTRGTKRNESAALQAWEQACRQRWRALALAIKAKLEAVECGITQFDEEFLAHIVLPNNQTYGEFALPQIERAYKTQKMPPLLPFFGGGEEKR